VTETRATACIHHRASRSPTAHLSVGAIVKADGTRYGVEYRATTHSRCSGLPVSSAQATALTPRFPVWTCSRIAMPATWRGLTSLPIAISAGPSNCESTIVRGIVSARQQASLMDRSLRAIKQRSSMLERVDSWCLSPSTIYPEPSANWDRQPDQVFGMDTREEALRDRHTAPAYAFYLRCALQHFPGECSGSYRRIVRRITARNDRRANQIALRNAVVWKVSS